MPKDEWGNIISDAKYDHIYHGSQYFTSKDEFGNIIEIDDRGNVKPNNDD
ncbi:MAG: hypothetical protein PHF86_01115 [Candidatus Nanoarchaeia archaeon]|nr:hypothetical protein [Candidatus Nanoarchaeia archaeon]